MYHADNDFGYEPTSEDIAAWNTTMSCLASVSSDPFISHTKEGSFWAPIHVFIRKSGARVEMDAKEYAELVNSQR